MLYSKTAKYAVLALAEVARRSHEDRVPTRAVAEAAAAPYALLAKIIAQLGRAGLVDASRGKQGGVALARAASEITIRDIVVALDGPAILNDCPLFLDPCSCHKECSLHPIWKPARDAVVQFLESTTVADVARARAAAGQPVARQAK